MPAEIQSLDAALDILSTPRVDAASRDAAAGFVLDRMLDLVTPARGTGSSTPVTPTGDDALRQRVVQAMLCSFAGDESFKRREALIFWVLQHAHPDSPEQLRAMDAWERMVAGFAVPGDRLRADATVGRHVAGSAVTARAMVVWAAGMQALPDVSERMEMIIAASRAMATPAQHLKRAIVESGLVTLPVAESSSRRYQLASFVESFATDDASRERAIDYLLADGRHNHPLENIQRMEAALTRISRGSALHGRVLAAWREMVGALPDPAGYLRAQLGRAHWPAWAVRDEAIAWLAAIDR